MPTVNELQIEIQRLSATIKIMADRLDSIPLPRDRSGGARNLSTPMLVGARREVGALDDAIAHTSEGGVQAGFVDPEQFALRLDGYGKNIETGDSAGLRFVVAQNSDGTWGVYPAVAF